MIRRMRRLFPGSPSSGTSERPLSTPPPSPGPVFVGRPVGRAASAKDPGAHRLHKAAWDGRLGRVADMVNRKSVSVEAFNVQGQTPLFVAAYTGDVDLASLLLSLGADANARCTGGYTPMHGACYAADPVLLEKLLLEHGGDLGTLDVWRQTPVDWVYENPDPCRREAALAVVEQVEAALAARVERKERRKKNLGSSKSTTKNPDVQPQISFHKERGNTKNLYEYSSCADDCSDTVDAKQIPRYRLLHRLEELFASIPSPPFVRKQESRRRSDPGLFSSHREVDNPPSDLFRRQSQRLQTRHTSDIFHSSPEKLNEIFESPRVKAETMISSGNHDHDNNESDSSSNSCNSNSDSNNNSNSNTPTNNNDMIQFFTTSKSNFRPACVISNNVPLSYQREEKHERKENPRLFMDRRFPPLSSSPAIDRRSLYANFARSIFTEACAEEGAKSDQPVRNPVVLKTRDKGEAINRKIGPRPRFPASVATSTPNAFKSMSRFQFSVQNSVTTDSQDSSGALPDLASNWHTAVEEVEGEVDDGPDNTFAEGLLAESTADAEWNSNDEEGFATEELFCNEETTVSCEEEVTLNDDAEVVVAAASDWEHVPGTVGREAQLEWQQQHVEEPAQENFIPFQKGEVAIIGGPKGGEEEEVVVSGANVWDHVDGVDDQGYGQGGQDDWGNEGWDNNDYGQQVEEPVEEAENWNSVRQDNWEEEITNCGVDDARVEEAESSSQDAWNTATDVDEAAVGPVQGLEEEKGGFIDDEVDPKAPNFVLQGNPQAAGDSGPATAAIASDAVLKLTCLDNETQYDTILEESKEECT